MEKSDVAPRPSNLLAGVYPVPVLDDVLGMEQICGTVFSKPLFVICAAPLSRITILQQVQGMYGATSKPGFYGEFSRILKEEGVRGFWKGNLADIARRPPRLAIRFLATYCFMHQLESLYSPNYTNPDSYLKQKFVRGTATVLLDIIASSAVYPMDLVRTRLAAQRSRMYYNGIWHALSTIYREEGLLGLYKGNGASILRKAPKTAIYVTSNALFQYSSLEESYYYRSNGSSCMMGIGSVWLCGLVSSTVTFPIDVVRRRLQLDGAGGQARIYNTGLLGTFKHIINKEGLRGLYRGVVPDFLKELPRIGLFFMACDMLKRTSMFYRVCGFVEDAPK